MNDFSTKSLAIINHQKSRIATLEQQLYDANRMVEGLREEVKRLSVKVSPERADDATFDGSGKAHHTYRYPSHWKIEGQQ